MTRQPMTLALLLALTPVLMHCQTAAPVAAATAANHSEREVSFTSSGLRLGGVLFLPEGAGPFPGVVLLQGSGDSRRDHAWTNAFVEVLVDDGIAVLVPDKRGNGTSAGDWRKANFDDYAQDAGSAAAFLRDTERVDPARVGVMGLSQGGHIVPLVGQRDPELAFVINVSGSATTPVEQVNHEMRNTFRQAGLDEEGIAAGMSLQQLAENYVQTGDWTSYETAILEALSTPLRPVAEGFPQTPDSWVWGWWRGIMNYDPIEHWSALTQPVLIVYGKEDELDNVPVLESVRRLTPIADRSPQRFDILVYPDSGHALYEAGTTKVRADLLDHLIDWIHENSD